MTTNYYSQDRRWPELFDIKPYSSILDVGCANGTLARRLMDTFGAHVTGIDILPSCLLDQNNTISVKVMADIEDLSIHTFCGKRFDYIIFSDSLEHIVHTDKVLRSFQNLLAPTGSILIALPNVQNYRVVCGLVNGDWRYTEWGLLDQTHLRFFTRKSILRKLNHLGFKHIICKTVIPLNSKAFYLNLFSLGLLRNFLATHIYLQIKP